MDYYGFFQLYFIYCLIQCATTFLIIISIIIANTIEKFENKLPKLKLTKKTFWRRAKNGRLERILQDSDKIQKLYIKWVNEAKMFNKPTMKKSNNKQQKIWTRKYGRLTRI
tara:strand:- start:1707 stop:2039 length:333 start_codon:yes stop_codon:yes gene_type:complete